MTRLTRSAGTRCLRWLVLPATLTALAALTAGAQEAPSSQERNAFDRYRSGAEPVGKDGKPLFEKYAKFYAAALTASETQRPGAPKGFSWLIDDLDKRLHVPQHNSPLAPVFYSRLKPEQRPFVDEFGKACVEAFEPATRSANPLVRVNAVRMIAEVARSGHDGAAEVCLKVLAKADESDGVKFYALQGLKNLFLIVPESQFPTKSIFQKDDTGVLPPLEQRSIQALIDFIVRQPTGEPSADDVDAHFYVRREAVRGLALVRVQEVRNRNAVVNRPALTLLKVARGDGLTPKSATDQGPDLRSAGERIEAVIGFSNLFPPRGNREMNIDYAAYHVGRALQDIAQLYQPGNTMTSTPWKTSMQRLRDALTNWQTRSADMKLDGANLIKSLLDAADRDVLQPIEQAQAGTPPNPVTMGEWAKQNQPKSKSLFKSDEKTTITLP
jgi:hypothetical protein